MLPKLPFHIYWINLERRQDRKNHMENILELNIHTRINAVDYKNHFAPYNVIQNQNLKPGEIGCICSHIIALYTFISTSTDEFAFIAEDDVDDLYSTYWKKRHFDLLLNPDIDILQMQTTADKYNNPDMIPVQTRDAGTTFYRIRRRIAQKIVRDFFNSETKTIDLTIHYRPVADLVIWNYGIVQLIPMISYLDVCDSETNSTEIMDDYWKNYFFSAKQKYLNYWRNLL